MIEEMGHEPISSPSNASTLLLQGEEVPFELEVISNRRNHIYSVPHMIPCFLLIKIFIKEKKKKKVIKKSTKQIYANQMFNPVNPNGEE